MPTHADHLITLRAGELAVTVDADAGSRLASVTWRGSELLASNDGSSFGWGSYVMAPYAGRIRNGRFRWFGADVNQPITMGVHAIHGTVHSTAWETLEQTSTRADLGIALGPDWPFGGSARHRIELVDAGDRRVDLVETVEVRAGDVAMPAWTGVHPWWLRHVTGATGPVELLADWSGAAKYRRDTTPIAVNELIRTGEGPWDDCFVGVRSVRMRWPGLVEMSLTTDARCLVVYDEPDHAVCVEPQTAPPDAVNMDPGSVLVVPGGSVSMHATWSFR